MNILNDHMKQTIRRIDALLDNYTIGTLIIENKAVSLLLEDNTEIQLDDSYAIEVFDGSQYHLITFDQALNTYCSDAPDWHLFAGI
jgi:anti-sigma-K factor RskA